MNKTIFLTFSIIMWVLSVTAENIIVATAIDDSTKNTIVTEKAENDSNEEMVECEMTDEEWDTELDRINARVNQIGKEMRQESIEHARQLLIDARENLSQNKYEEAKKQLLKIVDTDDVEPKILAQASLHLAEDICIALEGDYEKGLVVYEAVAQMDNTPDEQMQAWKRMGDLYSMGLLQLPKNEEYAIQLFKKLAKQKRDKKLSAYAHFKLGDIYRNTTNLDIRNLKLGLYHYKQAADQDVDSSVRVESWLELAQMAHCGEGMEKDFDKEIEYLTKASEQNDDMHWKAIAFFRMGRTYLADGFNFKERRDAKKALKYFYKVLELNPDRALEADARRNIALVHLKEPEGIEPDYQEGLKQVFIIAENEIGDAGDSTLAYMFLGDVYKDGLYGVEKDLAKAAEFYRKSDVPEGTWWRILHAGEINKRLKWVKEQEENETIK